MRRARGPEIFCPLRGGAIGHRRDPNRFMWTACAALRAPVGIIADTRERFVHPFLEAALKGNSKSRSAHLSADVSHTIAQIQVGDFIVTDGPPDLSSPVLAVVERKTHSDFASSLGDGRHKNKEKMLEMRRLTGCDVFYLMEGPAFPASQTRYGRVPWGTIQAAAFSLCVRDGIFLLVSQNSSGSAGVLNALARTYVKHKDSRSERPGPDAVAIKSGVDIRQAMAESVGPSLAQQGPKMQAIVGWSGLPGVTDATGAALVEQASVAAIARGVVSYRDIRDLRTPQGKRLSSAAKILRSVRLIARSPKDFAKFVGKIPGFSLALARGTFSACTPATVCAASAAELATYPYGRGAVGPVRACRLWEVLHFVEKGGISDRVTPAAPPVRPPTIPPPQVQARAVPQQLIRWGLYQRPLPAPAPPPRITLDRGHIEAVVALGRLLVAPDR